MTKEEIKQNDLLYYINEGKNQDETIGFIEGWEKGYSRADQETQRLKAELAEKDKEIEISHNENRRMERHFLETVTVINSLRELQTEDLKQLQSELTELKEKHKGDVIKTYIHCKEQRFGNYDLRQISFDAEQYYNETHKTK